MNDGGSADLRWSIFVEYGRVAPLALGVRCEACTLHVGDAPSLFGKEWQNRDKSGSCLAYGWEGHKPLCWSQPRFVYNESRSTP